MQKKEINVLYVDDEENNLQSFKATFRRTYNIYTATSVREALELIPQHEFHIVISDQRMPGETGVEFLQKLIEIYPDPIRVMMTAYADIEAVTDAINKGQVYRFIKKPWSEEELMMTIENAYEIYETRKELKKKNQELSKTNEELSRFVYSASHELKAPIMTMLGVLQVAGMESERDNPGKYLNMLDVSVRKLDFYILNIVNYYKNKRLEFKPEGIEFAGIVTETIEVLKAMREEGAPLVDYKVNINQKTPFVSDEFRTRVIFNNMLSNAVKYQRPESPDKFVKLEINVDADFANITIQDNGIGIPLEFNERIYDMFFRGTTKSTGSGIGLYITKEAINMVNGTIKMDSVEGKGTTFLIQIPNLANSAK